MKTAYWFAPTFFIANNVESRRCIWQNKHLFENPWVGAHSVRTENHCLSTQSVRVWFAVLTIGGASPRTKDFLPNAHLSCAPAAFGPFGNLSDLIELNPNIKMASQPDFYEPSDCNNTTWSYSTSTFTFVRFLKSHYFLWFSCLYCPVL